MGAAIRDRSELTLPAASKACIEWVPRFVDRPLHFGASDTRRDVASPNARVHECGHQDAMWIASRRPAARSGCPRSPTSLGHSRGSAYIETSTGSRSRTSLPPPSSGGDARAERPGTGHGRGHMAWPYRDRITASLIGHPVPDCGPAWRAPTHRPRRTQRRSVAMLTTMVLPFSSLRSSLRIAAGASFRSAIVTKPKFRDAPVLRSVINTASMSSP